MEEGDKEMMDINFLRLLHKVDLSKKLVLSFLSLTIIYEIQFSKKKVLDEGWRNTLFEEKC